MQVEAAEQPGDGRAEHPVLHGRAEVRVQGRGAEHHVVVGPGVGLPGVPGPDLVPDHPGGPVAAQHVAGGDLVAGAAGVTDRDGDRVVPLVQAGHGVPQAQVHARLPADVGAEHLFHDRLRDLLPRLGEPLVPAGHQPERAVEVGDAAPGQ